MGVQTSPGWVSGVISQASLAGDGEGSVEDEQFDHLSYVDVVQT